MFIAMNRFQVKIGSEAAFETVWRTRESYLSSMAGFVEFHLLKGPVAEDLRRRFLTGRIHTIALCSVCRVDREREVEG